MKTFFPLTTSVRFRAAVFCMCAGGVLLGDTPDDYEDVQWIRNTAEGGFDFSWNGRPERYYFVEMSTDLSAGSWSFFPYATKGDGGEAGIFISLIADRFFLRLRHTDDVESSLLTADFNQSGFSNRDQLDMGTDPFGTLDTNASGIPDDIEAFWAQVPDAWKLAVVNDPNTAFYDPDGAINSIEAVLPGDDYDGDGRTNLREYLDGSDPADFFNGEPPVLTIFWGNNQTAPSESFAEESLYVKVENGNGEGYINAPVKFMVVGGHAGLARQKSTSDLLDEHIGRTAAYGAQVYFYTPELSTGTLDSTVVASVPSGQNVNFTITADSDFEASGGVASIAAPGRPNVVDGPDLTTATLMWTDHSDNETTFRVERSENGGNYQNVSGNLPPDTTTWADTGLDPDKVYFYRIVSL